MKSSLIAVQIIIRNILHNAYSYTSEGEINIKIEKDRIIIIDSGVGLEKYNQQLSEVSALELKGENGELHCGIGLKLVRELCKHTKMEFSLSNRKDQLGTEAVLIFNQ